MIGIEDVQLSAERDGAIAGLDLPALQRQDKTARTKAQRHTVAIPRDDDALPNVS